MLFVLIFTEATVLIKKMRKEAYKTCSAKNKQGVCIDIHRNRSDYKENEREAYKTCCARNKQGAWLHIHGKHNVNKSS